MAGAGSRISTSAAGALRFAKSCRRPALGAGRYAYASGDSQPLAYGSVYGALARDLTGDLARAPRDEIAAWVDYIHTFQGEDGLFRDPAFGLPDDLSQVQFAADAGWGGGIAGWGWWHMTNHIYCALDSLGATARRPLALLEPFYRGRTNLERWLDERNWDNPWDIGNEVLNLGTFLMYARDYHNEGRAADLIERMFVWLDRNMDPATGYWGNELRSRKGQVHAMCGAYHEYILYYYDKRTIPHLEASVDTTLALQNEESGGFALDGSSGACEDIDAAFILVNAYILRDYRRADIRASMGRVLEAILRHQNPDGGFVYLRGRPYAYGHALMSTGTDESALFPTWFRLLSVALINQIVPHPLADGTPWRFNNCPYVQFFDQEAARRIAGESMGATPSA